jgi:predicted AlkP superfamily pyrophosphatase or phosphodiesterase
MTNRMRSLLSIFLAAYPVLAQAQKDRHVVVISLDGFPAYALRNPTMPLPALRRMIEQGAVAEGMETVNPAVTWPNHTSMVTGVTPAVHSVLYNGLAVRDGEGKSLHVEPWIDKAELVRAPTVYDLAHAARLTTAEVDWVAIHKAPTITWSFAEQPRIEGAVEREMVASGLVSEADLRNFVKAPITWRDEIWTRAAIHILERHRPNLLLFHLLATDSAQHRYGADSLAGNTALILADRQVQRILDSLKASGLEQTTTVLVVSDHGFKTYKKVIRPNAILAANGLIDDAWVIPEGGTAMVYVTRPGNKDQTLAKMKGLFSKVQGIAEVIGPDRFAELGLPSPVRNTHMADLALAAGPGFSFEGATQGEPVADVPASSTPGAHGYLSSDADMNAIFIAWGAGIKPGAKLGLIRNLDVAPTIARLLGLDMPSAAGRVLTGALR